MRPQVAENAPSLLYVHVAEVFQHLWIAMREPRVAVREGAAAALRAVLELVAGRESRLRTHWYRRPRPEPEAALAPSGKGRRLRLLAK